MVGRGKYERIIKKMKHDFHYISKRSDEVQEAYHNILDMITEVQNEVRNSFTFRFDVVGSYNMNMITYDANSNIGFDFDFNIEVNDEDENFSATKIKSILFNAFKKIGPRYGYGKIENSTRVITLKKVNYYASSIEHSCDFAIVYNYIEEGQKQQQYIHFNKKQQSYTWNKQGNGFYKLPEKLAWIKSNNLWNEFRDLYLYNKDNNTNEDNHSRQIRAITAHQICQKYGYYPNN